jgi:hypothetical protein
MEQLLMQSGTILGVTLAKPILPNSKLHSDFDGQVPIQIRRSK